MQDWHSKHVYQLTHYLLRAKQLNDSKSYSGYLWGMCGDVTQFAVLVPVLKGWVEIGQQNAVVGMSEGMDAQAVDVQAALKRIQALEGCRNVVCLSPGTYYVGDLYWSQVCARELDGEAAEPALHLFAFILA